MAGLSKSIAISGRTGDKSAGRQSHDGCLSARVEWSRPVTGKTCPESWNIYISLSLSLAALPPTCNHFTLRGQTLQVSTVTHSSNSTILLIRAPDHFNSTLQVKYTHLN